VILVRMVFQCKPGKAQEMVRGFKAMADLAPAMSHVRVLTDLSGPFDTVVEEVQAESIDAFLRASEAMFADPRWGAAMAQYAENVEKGSKEYYTIEYDS
jgi:hypothetical protein